MNQSKDVPNYLTPSEVAEMLFVSPVTVRQWSQKGWLNAEHTAGGHRRYLREEVERFRKERGLKLHSETSNELRIMVIDDDPHFGGYIKELFDGQDGVEAFELSQGGFEAGMQVRTFKPDVIMLDLMMPKLDGYSVCRFLKNDPLTKDIRVIAMTGYNSDENEKRILKEGAEMCMSKPVDTDLLFSTLGVGKYFSEDTED